MQLRIGARHRLDVFWLVQIVVRRRCNQWPVWLEVRKVQTPGTIAVLLFQEIDSAIGGKGGFRMLLLNARGVNRIAQAPARADVAVTVLTAVGVVQPRIVPGVALPIEVGAVTIVPFTW